MFLSRLDRESTSMAGSVGLALPAMEPPAGNMTEGGEVIQQGVVRDHAEPAPTPIAAICRFAADLVQAEGSA